MEFASLTGSQSICSWNAKRSREGLSEPENVVDRRLNKRATTSEPRSERARPFLVAAICTYAISASAADPVCIDNAGQGSDSANLTACHGYCLLLKCLVKKGIESGQTYACSALQKNPRTQPRGSAISHSQMTITLPAGFSEKGLRPAIT